MRKRLQGKEGQHERALPDAPSSKQAHRRRGWRQGNRLKDLGCLADEGFEVAWVPSGELAAVFEACGWRGLSHEVPGHVRVMGLTMAMFSGPWPVRKRASSSWKTTSMTQCRRFSTPQWARTARAKDRASRRAEER